ncbi:hypothetical protein AAHC03_017120 [Spirometra sp. Aus1]
MGWIVSTADNVRPPVTKVILDVNMPKSSTARALTAINASTPLRATVIGEQKTTQKRHDPIPQAPSTAGLVRVEHFQSRQVWQQSKPLHVLPSTPPPLTHYSRVSQLHLLFLYEAFVDS